MKLNLTKVSRGYYENNIGNAACNNLIRISLSNPYRYLGEGSNEWQLYIEVQDDLILNEWFSTKKQASEFGARFLTNLTK